MPSYLPDMTVFFMSTTKTIQTWSLASAALHDVHTDFMLSRQAMSAKKTKLEFYYFMVGKFLEWAELHGITSPEEITTAHRRGCTRLESGAIESRDPSRVCKCLVSWVTFVFGVACRNSTDTLQSSRANQRRNPQRNQETPHAAGAHRQRSAPVTRPA